jgi:hypothetical protein
MRGTITHANHTKGIYRLRCEDGLYRVVECEDASALHYESGRGDLGDQFFE